MTSTAARQAGVDLRFLWLEITGRCQLSCVHCYAESGPQGTHGSMAVDDWRRVIDDGAALGVRMVQFIGGEPTLHPDLPCLVEHVLDQCVAVEVFTNLLRVTPRMWDIFARPGVRLATSYYTDDAGQHETITKRPGSHAHTTANIVEAVRRSIPLRVGLIDITDDQRTEQARRHLAALGVTNVGTDQLRQVGRGVREQRPGVSQLCGACAHGKVAVAPNGDVWPCVFARWLSLGNVRMVRLAEILVGQAAGNARRELARSVHAKCNPNTPSKCGPESRCDPSKSSCSPHCPPSYHSDPKRCWPYYYEEKPK